MILFIGMWLFIAYEDYYRMRTRVFAFRMEALIHPYLSLYSLILPDGAFILWLISPAEFHQL